MKKLFFLIPLALIAVALFAREETKEIRIRVIANSDSKYDQDQKKEVVVFLADLLPKEFASYSDADNYLSRNISAISEAVTMRFTQAKVSYENHNFANKAYDKVVLDNQTHKTLLVELGHAVGENWWGSIFPFRGGGENVKYEWYFGKYWTGEK